MRIIIICIESDGQVLFYANLVIIAEIEALNGYRKFLKLTTGVDFGKFANNNGNHYHLRLLFIAVIERERNEQVIVRASDRYKTLDEYII